MRHCGCTGGHQRATSWDADAKKENAKALIGMFALMQTT